jgi:hypothetical protein
MDQPTLELLRGSLRAVLGGDDRGAIAKELADLGWDEVLADDRIEATLLLFEVRGEVLSAADSLGPLLAERIGGGVVAVVLPTSLDPARPSSAIVGDDLEVHGVVLADADADAGAVAVPVDGRVAVTTGDRLATSDLGGADDGIDLRRVRGRVPVAELTWIDDDDRWDAAVAAGRWALGAELVGLSRRVVADAVAYTIDRKQFGRPIGSFQAVQHRLASAHATTVGASHVVAEAAASGRPWDALVAKCLAGRAAEESCTQAQQAFGAIGFTWEHPFHRSLRRTYALDRLLGGWRDLEVEIGRCLREGAEVPKLGAL